jgi:hypothetical protein
MTDDRQPPGLDESPDADARPSSEAPEGATPGSSANRRRDLDASSTAIGISLGIAFGAALGVALGNVAIGVGIGIALGAAFGAAYGASRAKG